MILIKLLLFILFYLSIEILYFKISKRYNITDKPNERSSHKVNTIRGGGIIFPISVLLVICCSSDLENRIFSIGIFIIATLSFADDIRNINSKIKLLVQSICVIGLLSTFRNNFNLIDLVSIFILITGIINAYNFMDGINGMTAFYSIVTTGSLFFVNFFFSKMGSDTLFISLFASLLVFSFFNVRKRAKCFAGDVGSVSLAFIISYLILKLSIQTGFLFWILFLGIYGIDTVFTIICRIFRKEPLLNAHRSHLYQFLANEAGWSHLQVSSLFTISQLVFNTILIYSYYNQARWMALATLFVFLTIYTIFRLRLEGRKRLFVSYNPE